MTLTNTKSTSHPYPELLYFSNSDSLEFHALRTEHYASPWNNCVVKYDGRTGRVEYVKQMAVVENDEVTTIYPGISPTLIAQYAAFAEDSNYLFVNYGGGALTATALPIPECWKYTMDNDTLDIQAQNAYVIWLKFDKSDGRYMGYTAVRYRPRSEGTGRGVGPESSAFTVKNNRVFQFLNYLDEMDFQDTTYFHDTYWPNLNVCYALGIWDYAGHELQFEDLYHRALGQPTLNFPQIRMTDSICYLADVLVAPGRIGGIELVPQNGEYSIPYVAQYVDTSFRSAAVYVDPREKQQIEWEQELWYDISERRVRLTATATSGRVVEYRCSDEGVARVEGDMLYLLDTGRATVTAIQAGSYYYYPVTVAKPLQVFDTSSHGGETGVRRAERGAARLWPNPGRWKVTVDLPGDETGMEAVFYDCTGRETARYTEREMDVSSLQQGMYVVKIRTERDVYVTKFVKRD